MKTNFDLMNNILDKKILNMFANLMEMLWVNL